MNRKEFNDKAEAFADWALDSIRNRDHSWIILLVSFVLTLAILKNCVG
jgi:hypothetical protein